MMYDHRSEFTTIHIGGVMNLVDRAKNIILTPKTEWPVIAGETPNTQALITGYVIPLALIPAVAQMIGGLLLGSTFGTFVFPASYYIGIAVVGFVVGVANVFLTAYVIDYLAPNFGSEKDFGRSLQLVVYAYTPAWVAGILQIIPALGILAFIGALYSIYLMYLGLPVLKKTPPDKIVVYLVVSIVVMIVIYFVLSAILTSIVLGIVGVGAMTSGAFGR